MKSLIIDPMALWGEGMPEQEMWALIQSAYQLREVRVAVPVRGVFVPLA